MRERKFVFVLTVCCLALACGKDKKKVAAPAPVADSRPTGGGTNPPPTTSGDTGTAPDPKGLKNVIYFEFDQSELSPDSRSILENNADWLKEDGKRKLTIEGHTDEVGTPEYNLGLGERRAKAAKDYLIALGVEEARVQIITFGEEKPASDDDSLNRRSMFIATKAN